MEFRAIPGYHRKYLISKCGVLIDTTNPTPVEKWFTPTGYCCYALRRPDGKKTVGNRHRLMMIAWRPTENMGNLVVNHINGIPGDDWLENFEWCTYRENSEHAGRLGLSPKCKAVELLDVATGEVYYFDSATAAGRELGTTKDKILYRCHHDVGRVYEDGMMYRFATSDEWGDTFHKPDDRSRPVKVLDVLSGAVTTYSNLTDFANSAGIALSTAQCWVSKENTPTLPGFIQMKYLEDTTEWRVIDDPFIDYETSNRMQVYVIQNKVNNLIGVMCNLKDVAAYAGVKHTTIHMRFKQSKNRDFGDFIIMPYREFIRSNGHASVQLNVL